MKPSREILARWYAPETGDVVVWKPADGGRKPFTGRWFVVLAVEDGWLCLRDPRSGDARWEELAPIGTWFVLQTAEERVAEELMR